MTLLEALGSHYAAAVEEHRRELTRLHAEQRHPNADQSQVDADIRQVRAKLEVLEAVARETTDAEPLRWDWGAAVSLRTGLPRASVHLSLGDTEYVIARAIAETAACTMQGTKVAALDGAIATMLATVRAMQQQRDEIARTEGT